MELRNTLMGTTNDNSSKIKVLHVFDNLNIGGAETLIINILREVDLKKFQYDFVVHSKLEGYYEREIKKMGCKIYRVPKLTGLNYFEYIKSWRNIFEGSDSYDIIHGHVRTTASIYLKIAKMYNISTIIHSHSTNAGFGFKKYLRLFMQKKIIDHADYFFACSKKAGGWLFNDEIVNSDKFKIIENGINLENLKYDNKKRKLIRSELGISDEEIVVCHIGNFKKEKNHSFLVEMFNQLHNINYKTKLILVGSGVLFDEVEKQVEKNGLKKAVFLIGAKQNVEDYLSASDIFVLPSFYEGIPVSLIEAQANGLKILCSNTIDSSIDLTSSIKYCNLEEGAISWAKTILTITSNSCDRLKNQTLMENSNYNIKLTSKKISDIYLGIATDRDD